MWQKIKNFFGTCPYCGGTDYMCGCTPDNHPGN